MAPKVGSTPWNKGKTSRKVNSCFVCGKDTFKKYCSRECQYSDPLRSEAIRSKQLGLVYKEKECAGCSATFTPHNFRQKFCNICKIDVSLRARMGRYNLTGVEVTSLMLSNNGKCALCNRQSKYVDHDHSTGKVRGALCPGCNTALSRVDEEGWLERAKNYVSK